ncbi:hypothetical protein C8R47DRAFT_1072790 [Mycena vitilis]|nr:hypothetical protein C8R47DRAFT_1072790 [Mycena vitilis]
MDDFNEEYWTDKLGDVSKLPLDTKLHMILSLAAVLQDRDRVIGDMSLQIRIKDLTISGIRELLDPSKLADKYRALAPFFFELLHVFAASPNDYRKWHMDKGPEVGSEGVEVGSEPEKERDWEDDPNEDHDEAGHPEAANTSQWKGLRVLVGTPFFMLAFVRNRATNLLLLLLCLFFKISGTSTRVTRMLSNIGVCVSSRTAERLKQRISDDAIRLGVALVHSKKMWMTQPHNAARSRSFGVGIML